ncbi:hypothetical protein [Kitasatospora sp. NPDC004272]
MQPAPTQHPHPCPGPGPGQEAEPEAGTGTDAGPVPHCAPTTPHRLPAGTATLRCLAAAGTDTDALLEHARVRRRDQGGATVIPLPDPSDQAGPR